MLENDRVVLARESDLPPSTRVTATCALRALGSDEFMYLTPEFGAEVGPFYMPISTAHELSGGLADWMPWNYRDTLPKQVDPCNV